ncbi:hypothetical protein OSB04_001192 [Centaurea solstitialis]|uniref:Reverse transcriptase zinc-binding domain-containing protein n=1 Tax=Centaurea solstitialis TaxID=347529 RepID=A0AA38U137_9ASTR|nr:hypothetical protein OSB04_001192 [Centaurea solstitialis]
MKERYIKSDRTKHIHPRVPLLEQCPIPTLQNVHDTVSWRKHDGIVPFTVKDAWDSMYANQPMVHWHKIVWFLGHIPKHAMCLWQTCHYRCPDTHNHLFFSCTYARAVWRHMKQEADLHGFLEDWDSVMIELGIGRRQNTIQKLSIAASRNLRTFQRRSRTVIELTKVIKETVLMLMAWKKRNTRVAAMNHGD